jgi:hypothetical protein
MDGGMDRQGKGEELGQGLGLAVRLELLGSEASGGWRPGGAAGVRGRGDKAESCLAAGGETGGGVVRR